MAENNQLSSPIPIEADSIDGHGNRQQLHLKNLFSLIPKFELKLPFFDQLLKPRAQSVATSPTANSQIAEQVSKPCCASFSNTIPTDPPVLELEAERTSGRTSNPVVLWQVYAIGGFYVAKWMWASWNERKDKKCSSHDNQLLEDEESTENHQSAADEES